MEMAGYEDGEHRGADELTIATRMRVLMSADSAYVARLVDTVALGLPQRHVVDSSHPIILEARSRAIVAVNNEWTNEKPAIAVILPNTRLEAIEWHDDSVRVGLGGRATGWLSADALRPSGATRQGGSATPQTGVIARNDPDDPRVTRIHVGTNGVPVVRLEETRDSLTVRLINVDGFGPFISATPEQTLERLSLRAQLDPDRKELVLRVRLRAPIQGYEVDTGGTGVVVVLRYPPLRISDWRVLIDPGHPPRGAIGPAGTQEADVTLAVARRLQGVLLRRGVHATLTRSNKEAVSLAQRVSLVATERADIVLSLHADGVPDGVDPYERDGTRSYYLHEHAKPLAQALQSALTSRLGTQDRGIRVRDLALTRPSGPAAVLCELATLAIPEYEFLLSTTAFQRAAASALAEGVLFFINARHSTPLPK
jgi:N-acetylmuramoyl-L-alanine amidase